jgi:hypothetical protein
MKYTIQHTDERGRRWYYNVVSNGENFWDPIRKTEMTLDEAIGVYRHLMFVICGGTLAPGWNVLLTTMN